MLALLWQFRRYVAYALLAAALIGALTWYRHSLIAAGIKQGEARINALWQADTAKRDAIAAHSIAAAREKEQTARDANALIEDAYEQKLVAAAGEHDGYFRMLQQARGKVLACGAREATSATIAATAGEASIADRIDRATAGLITEARNNADQLDALIGVVKPQL